MGWVQGRHGWLLGREPSKRSKDLKGQKVVWTVKWSSKRSKRYEGTKVQRYRGTKVLLYLCTFVPLYLCTSGPKQRPFYRLNSLIKTIIRYIATYAFNWIAFTAKRLIIWCRKMDLHFWVPGATKLISQFATLGPQQCWQLSSRGVILVRGRCQQVPLYLLLIHAMSEQTDSTASSVRYGRDRGRYIGKHSHLFISSCFITIAVLLTHSHLYHQFPQLRSVYIALLTSLPNHDIFQARQHLPLIWY